MIKEKIDDEIKEILYDISNIKIKKEKDFLTDYINKMKEIRNEILSLSKEKDSFEKNIEKIKEDLYDLGTLFYCYNLFMKEFAEKNKEVYLPVERIDHIYNGFPGSHDFNLCLSRMFSWQSFNDFYKIWLDDINVFIQTKTEYLPRYLHEISKIKGKKEYIVKTKILLTKKDLGFNPSYLEIYQKNRTKENLSKLLDYKNNWKFKNCMFPKYYPMLKETNFPENIYMVCEELEKNPTFYNKLKDVHFLELKF